MSRGFCVLVGKFLYFNELTNEARRQLTDFQQRAEGLRAVRADLRHRYAGSMSWKVRSDREYLYRRRGTVEKSLGLRSSKTEEIYRTFSQGRAAAEQLEKGLRTTLEGMASVNRALRLDRVPKLVGRVLRRLDDAGVLGDQVCVVGTNALFAYEAYAGIRFESGLLATGDVDIALDARRNLGLAAKAMPTGLLGLLRKIDPSFSTQEKGAFRAVNASGFMVDLITPEPKERMASVPPRQRRLGGGSDMTTDDMEAVEVPRLEMIVDAPRFSAIAMSEDGLPVWISAADPRWWAAHKLWLSNEPSREPVKRQRDHAQGIAVATMLARNWGAVDLTDEALASIPIAMRTALRDAVGQAAADDTQRPEW